MKLVAQFALAAFVVSSASCVTWSRKQVRALVEPPAEGTAVLSVVMNSGQVIQFTKSNPGRVRGYKIVGTPKDALKRQVEITGPFSSIIMDGNGRITEVVDGEGQGYVVHAVLSRYDNRMTIMASESNQVSIRLSEVSVIQVRQDNALPIAAIILGGLVVLPTLLALLF